VLYARVLLAGLYEICTPDIVSYPPEPCRSFALGATLETSALRDYFARHQLECYR